MKPADKIRVAVLYGGRSAEHEVSIRSAANVIQFLDASRFDIIPIGVDKQGAWFLGQDVFAKSLEHNQVSNALLKEGTWFAPGWVSNPNEHRQTAAPVTVGAHFDVIFPVMHGTFCEDGTLQGLLEMTNLPYVGCGVLASAVGMDKDVSKRLAIMAGVAVSPYVVVKRGLWDHSPEDICQQIEENIGYPVFVKPANAGSSIGISKAKTKDQLKIAIDEAFKFDTKILVEKGLNVVELEVAILESLDPAAEPIASVVGEVRSTHEFYSYEAKYLDENGAALLIPAPVSDEIQKEAQTIAKKLFAALECEGMARVDLFLDKDSNKLYFNEINTIPGFTQISMYPKLMAASGLDYTSLLTHLVQLAMNRYESKNKLIRTYA